MRIAKRFGIVPRLARRACFHRLPASARTILFWYRCAAGKLRHRREQPCRDRVSGQVRILEARRFCRTMARAAVAAAAAVDAVGAGVVREHQAGACCRPKPALAQRLGRHFIVGYSSFDEVARLAEKGLISGVYVSQAQCRAAEAAGDQGRDRGAAGAPPPRRPAAPDRRGRPGRRRGLASVAAADKAAAAVDARGVVAGRSREEGGGVRAASTAASWPRSVSRWTSRRCSTSSRRRKRNRFDFNTMTSRARDFRGSGGRHRCRARLCAWAGGLRRRRDGQAFSRARARAPRHPHRFSADLDTPIEELEASDWRPFKDRARAFESRN